MPDLIDAVALLAVGRFDETEIVDDDEARLAAPVQRSGPARNHLHGQLARLVDLDAQGGDLLAGTAVCLEVVYVQLAATRAVAADTRRDREHPIGEVSRRHFQAEKRDWLICPGRSQGDRPGERRLAHPGPPGHNRYQTAR